MGFETRNPEEYLEPQIPKPAAGLLALHRANLEAENEELRAKIARLESQLYARNCKIQHLTGLCSEMAETLEDVWDGWPDSGVRSQYMGFDF